jgi:hypothetical protein
LTSFLAPRNLIFALLLAAPVPPFHARPTNPFLDALTIFFNSLGGALAISIAQNIFSNTLVTKITQYAPAVNPLEIIAAGATHVRDVTPPASLAGVLQGYNGAVTSTYIVAIAAGGVAFGCSLFMEWKSVKGKKLAVAGAA